MIRLYLWFYRVLFVAREPRVRWAPGLSCALCFSRVVRTTTRALSAPREREVAFPARHAPLQAGHPVSRDVSCKHYRLWNTGSPGPVYANRLRPKADFGGSRGFDGLAVLGPPKL
jgi:hypothetical protein